MRLGVFAANAELVRRHNDHSNASWTMALNEFADLSHDEFVAAFVGGYRPRAHKGVGAAARAPALDALPASVDWVTAGAVTAVGNQGKCGACCTLLRGWYGVCGGWGGRGSSHHDVTRSPTDAFSAAGAVEGITHITTGVLPNLSEQQVVDCSGPQGNMGCSGGTFDQAFSYIVANGGLCTAEAYPCALRRAAL